MLENKTKILLKEEVSSLNSIDSHWLTSDDVADGMEYLRRGNKVGKCTRESGENKNYENIVSVSSRPNK